jgi:alkaline phosphatase
MGRDAFPETERDHLNELVKQAHDHGRILRFWGHPDRPEVWAELQKAGVDLINTDRLNNLAAFLKEVNKPRSDGQ